eukprot:scaffold50000_cov45-Phaeocystis_antarctica.AAC.1
MSKSLLHLTNRELSRGWVDWLALVIRRVNTIHAVQRSLVHWIMSAVLVTFGNWRRRFAVDTAHSAQLARFISVLSEPHALKVAMRLAWRHWRRAHTLETRSVWRVEHALRLLINRELCASWNSWAESTRVCRATPSLHSRLLTRAWNRWLETVVDGLTHRAVGRQLVARSVAQWRLQQQGLGWHGWRDAYAEYVRTCQRGFRALGYSRRQKKEAAVRGWQAFARSQRGLKRFRQRGASASVAHHRSTALRTGLEGWAVWALEHKATTKQLRRTAVRARARTHMQIRMCACHVSVHVHAHAHAHAHAQCTWEGQRYM